jgi:ABC-type transport system involved in cytochrome bd biosynthesis fused ATPase/permease subunit
MSMSMIPMPAPLEGPCPQFAALERARTAAKPGLRRVLGWQIARSVLRLSFLATTAMLVGRLVMNGTLDAGLLTFVIASLAAAALASSMADRTQAVAEAGVAARLRSAAGTALMEKSAGALRALPAGTLTMSMQRHPPAIAALVLGHKAATMMMALGPLLAAAALFCVSWQAAALMLVLTPAMIVFFALVGETIRTRADAQERAFGHLSGQFADRIRTLPTIVGNHALDSEGDKLTQRLRAYSTNTMAVLRIAFLNSAIIDFFASLSIAMLAVFLGLGHLKLAMIPGFSNLELWQSLFILMIAPDYFAPFRRFSEQYHAKAEGLAAATALDRLLGPDERKVPAIPSVEGALARLSLPERGLVAIVGPSGAGKSILLRRLAGLEGAGPLDFRPMSWIATDAQIKAGTLGDVIGGKSVSPQHLDAAARRAGLLDDEQIPGGLNAPIDAGGVNLSGGQRMRVIVARAMLSDRSVIADEPTAKLDARTAGLIHAALHGIAQTRLVVAATHDPELAEMADLVIDLSEVVQTEAA